METYRDNLLLYLILNLQKIETSSNTVKGVSEIGHYGTGDLEVRVEKKGNFVLANEFVGKANGNSSPQTGMNFIFNHRVNLIIILEIELSFIN